RIFTTIIFSGKNLKNFFQWKRQEKINCTFSPVMDHPVSGPVALVLTATITPFVSFVELNDSSQRLNNYLDALRFYISNCDFPIYFVENSGYPMEESTEFNNWCKSGRVQWIKATPHPDHSKGKGFQEFYMLDQVMDL